jgi:diaminohydroxyphosphoribosylaminopyrimidine deaminase/5-amino-6-(5-phosphoribosylamino)uracil reductase
MPIPDYDEYFMREALALAKQGWGRTGVNPLVGAVVVRDGRVAGRGYHRKIGEAHAETVALLEAGARARGATLYVNLEPCCTCGHTPPCVDSILTSGVKRTVVAMPDPNPLVNGKGVACLIENGLMVASGVLKDEAELLNRAYGKYITQKVPYVILKLAASRDGKIAREDKIAGPGGRYLTGETARRYVHSLRGRVDAILIGINTVLADNPYLTDRFVGRHNPARIVIDPRLRIPLDANFLIPDARRVIITSRNGDPQKIEKLITLGAEFQFMDGFYFPFKSILRIIGGLEIGSVLVEGGAIVFSQIFSEGSYDELYFFQAPGTIDRGLSLTDDIERIMAIAGAEISSIGEDTLYHVYRHN